MRGAHYSISLNTAREVALEDARREVDEFVLALRKTSVDDGYCKVCEQEIPPAKRDALRLTIPASVEKHQGWAGGIAEAMARLGRSTEWCPPITRRKCANFGAELEALSWIRRR